MTLPYLDYNATTPVDPRVVEAMLPVLSKEFGNPSSTHQSGMYATSMVDTARSQISNIVGRNSHDVIFTSGATEANNMVMFGLKNTKVLIGATEHKSVLGACDHLESCKVMTVPVTTNGVTDLDKLAKMMDKDVKLVSIMAANSETGVIQPINKISKLVHEYDALLHCDATQAIGKIPFDANTLNVDIVTMSSHKIYGPKGCGAIVATREARRQLTPMILGGGQQNDMRSGTLNVPGIVGFGKACEIATNHGLEDHTRQESLRNHFEETIMSSIDGISINGHTANRLPNTSNIRIAGVMADAVIVNTSTIQISTGSACTSSSIEPSHVLVAMGLDRTSADESIRLSIGRPTTLQDIEIAVSEITDAVKFVRERETEIPERLV